MRHVKIETGSKHYGTPVMHKGEWFIFDSMTELVDYNDPNLFEVHSDPDWVGMDLPNWGAVDAASKKDWKEGLDILADYVEKLTDSALPEVKSHRRKVRYNEFDGDEIDYDRLRAGQEYWRKSERETTTGPSTMTILVDTSAHWGKRSKDILWRGAAALALTQILEEKGYSVELWLVNGSTLFSGKNTRVMTACCLKRCSDPLDISTAINSMSGWFYRTVGFTVDRTICKKQEEGVAYGLGAVATPTQDELDTVTSDELRVYSSGVYSFDGALAMIVGELEKINNLEEEGVVV